MFLRDHEGREYHVRFEYDECPGWGVRSVRRMTACKLDGPVGHAVGIAECSQKDQFVKKTGRKVAFTKALKKAGLPREARTALWQGFLSKTSK